MPRQKPVKIERPIIHGLADKANRIIEVDARLKGAAELQSYIHEGLHVSYPHMSEKSVCRGEQTLADILWRAGYRRAKRKGD